MINDVTLFFKLLTKKSQKEFAGVVVFGCFVALLELVTIGLTFPMIQLLINPGQPMPQQLVEIFELLGSDGFITSSKPILLLAAIAFIVTSFLTFFYHAFCFKAATNANQRLSLDLLDRYLSQDYEFFTKSNSVELTKNIAAEVDNITLQVFMPLCNLFGRVFLVVLSCIILTLINPGLSLVVYFVLFALYLTIGLMGRNTINRLGIARTLAMSDRMKNLSEIFVGIKVVKTSSSELYFRSKTESVVKHYNRVSFINSLIGAAPKFLFESLLVGGTLIGVYFLFDASSENKLLIPLLGTLAAAFYRILPSIQQIYQGYTSLKYFSNLIKTLTIEQKLAKKIRSKNQKTDFGAFKTLESDGVIFEYGNSKRHSLVLPKIKIKRGDIVGIVGPSGAGKSTLIEVLMGLLIPKTGYVNVNGINLTAENITEWHKKIGYVQQEINLFDGSLASNVAFGLHEDKIDEKQVNYACESAGLSDLIRDLSDGINAKVGDRGLLLSGGQKQRLGLARALYKNPEVLILDEATSGLDKETEKLILDDLLASKREKTILTSAHRRSALTHCDYIIYLERGSVLQIAPLDKIKSLNDVTVA